MEKFCDEKTVVFKEYVGSYDTDNGLASFCNFFELYFNFKYFFLVENVYILPV